MNTRTLLFAASLLPMLIQPAFAQADAHHPAGDPSSSEPASSAPVARSEQPAPVDQTTMSPPNGAAAECPSVMSMADMMTMMQPDPADTPQMRMMKMMQLMEAMQAMQLTMMQQFQDDMMKNGSAPVGK